MTTETHLDECLDRLAARLRLAQVLTPELLSEVTAQACTRFGALSAAAKIPFHRLVESAAWTDAVLALLALELPQLKLRRAQYEDGLWYCALSREPRLPLALDELSEATHESLPMAILMAFLDARRTATASPRVTAVPRVRPMAVTTMCCDNFA
jgi:hypothetical protein